MSSHNPDIPLSGVVHHSSRAVAQLGDVALHPGANRTNYIDAYVWDGQQMRSIALSSFGLQKQDRTFHGEHEIGRLMRSIEATIARNKGRTLRFEVPAGGSRRKYVLQPSPFPPFLGRPFY